MQSSYMEMRLSPTSSDAERNTNFDNPNTAMPPDDYSFYLAVVSDALRQDDITCLHSIAFEGREGNDWSNNNSVSGKQRERGREEDDRGDDRDGSPSRRRGGSVDGLGSPFPRLVTSPPVMEEQESAEGQRELPLSEANHKENADDMAIYDAYLRDPHEDDQDESEGIRCRRAKGVRGGVGDVAAGVRGPPYPLRRLWVRQRSHTWWHLCNSPDFPEGAFRRAFRMSRETFRMVCDEVGPAVARGDTVFRAAIPVHQRVAVCIWRLATGEPLRFVSRRFGLGLATCHKLVPEVCDAIKSVLLPKFLKWPSDSGLEEIRAQFELLSGIPDVVGSMYTTHIPIVAPPKRAKNSAGAYLNKRNSERCQKVSYTITVQGVVRPDGVFTDVCIGWPGSLADKEVLEKSALYQRAAGGALEGQWIVGGRGYPLLDWLLVPYARQNLTWTQHAFNENIGEVQRVAKEAFARLKGRWRCTLERSKVAKPQELHGILGACCVLHNICEMRKEAMDPQLRVGLEDDDMVPENNPRSASAKQARDIIAHKLFHHDLAGTAFSNFLRDQAKL